MTEAVYVVALLLPIVTVIVVLFFVRATPLLKALTRSIISLLTSSIFSATLIYLDFYRESARGRPHNSGEDVVFVPLLFIITICVIIIGVTHLAFWRLKQIKAALKKAGRNLEI